MVKISIIVPTHNPGKYLEPLINSILNQTLKDIEIIFVDDGSTDGTKENLLKYKKQNSRIQVHLREKQPYEQFGQKYSADIGRRAATGSYIMIMDHDDELLNENALQILYDATDNETIDVVQGRNITLNEQNELTYRTLDVWPQKTIISSDQTQLSNEQLFNHMVAGPCAVWACLIKREFQKDIQLADCVYNDVDFIFKLKYLAKTFCYIPEYIYLQNEHIGSASSKTYTDIHEFQVFEALNNLEKFLKQQGASLNDWKIYTLYKFRMLSGHATAPFSSNDIFIKFISQAKREMQREINILNLVKYYWPKEAVKEYLDFMEI